MRTRTIAALLIAALVLTAGAAMAQRGRGGPGQGMGMGMGMPGSCGLGLGLGMGPAVVSELGLTNDQVAQIQKITDQFVTDTQQLRAQLQTRLKELAQLWTAEEPNKSAIRSKIAEVDRVRAQIRDAMIDRTFATMKVLTPAQKTKLRDLVKNRPGFGVGMGYGLGMGCGMGGGNCYMMGGPGGQGLGGGRGYRGGRNN
jgi:Spy/CpxP family protein refolding chaperone